MGALVKHGQRSHPTASKKKQVSPAIIPQYRLDFLQQLQYRLRAALGKGSAGMRGMCRSIAGEHKLQKERDQGAPPSRKLTTSQKIQG